MRVSSRLSHISYRVELEYQKRMDTKLEIGCDRNANCTSLSSPGSSIAFPIAFSLVGILGNWCIHLLLLSMLFLFIARSILSDVSEIWHIILRFDI